MKSEPQTAPADVRLPSGSGIKRQSLWGMMPLLVISVVNVVSVPLFLRTLGHDMYALMGYIAVFTGMFGFADLGLGVVVGRYIGVALGKGDQDAVRSYWATGNSIVLPMLLTMAIVFAGLGAWLGPKWFHVAPGDEMLLRSCFVAGGFGLFFNYYTQFWFILAQVYLDFKFVSVLRTTLTLLQVIPQVAIAFATGNPLFVIAWGALVGFVGLAGFVWHAWKKYGLGLGLKAASWSRVSEMAGFAAKSFVGLLVASVFNSVDRAIVGRMAPPVDFNPYNISANLAGRLQGLSTAVQAPVLFNTSRVVEGERNYAARIYDESFAFVFEWYLLACLWVALWNPVLLRLWRLDEETAMKASPLVTPLIIACSFSALANISAATLSSFNRLGTAVVCNFAAGLLALGGVWVGWHFGGAVGAAYGFLFSRIAFLAQDLLTIHLIKGGGWMSSRTWKQVAGQCVVAAAFTPICIWWPRDSYWMIVPAILHGCLVSAWLLRTHLQKMLAPVKTFPAL